MAGLKHARAGNCGEVPAGRRDHSPAPWGLELVVLISLDGDMQEIRSLSRTFPRSGLHGLPAGTVSTPPAVTADSSQSPHCGASAAGTPPSKPRSRRK